MTNPHHLLSTGLVKTKPKQKMRLLIPSPRLRLLFLFLFALSWRQNAAAAASINLHDNFLNCASLYSASISSVVYTPQNSSYSAVLGFTAHNLRYNLPTSPKPLLIVTPTQISHVQTAVLCARQNGIQVRTRSGGHDYEGLSYVSLYAPFILVDMIRLNSIHVDVDNQVASVQVGATLGNLYYAISQKSGTLGFPAGITPNVGVGGHISGGGYGILQRKYGLAGDNTIDAQIVDVNGRLLDRKSMGEDLFWAIRGAGGASFGVIISFKVQLVTVPANLTICTLTERSRSVATNIMYDWQFVTPYMPNELSSYLVVSRDDSTAQVPNTLELSLIFHYLGGLDEVLALFDTRFPQLGLSASNCTEMSWIQTVVLMAGLPVETPLTQLLNRTLSAGPLRAYRYYAKMKSDYVETPMPLAAMEGIWDRMTEPEARIASSYFVAGLGKMGEISESATPYPHRGQSIYFAAYINFWDEEGVKESKRYISWNRRLYRFMKPYVSKSPRRAYMNYRDLDVGTNLQLRSKAGFSKTTYFGFKYYGDNLHRLISIKAKVDPTNFFQTEQSVPLLPVTSVASY